MGDGCQRGLASMVYKFFDKKNSATRANKIACGTVKNEIMSNKKLAEELRKPLKKFKKRKVYSPFTDNIWDADLANMQSISKFNDDSDFYYALLIFSVNTHGLFL